MLKIITGIFIVLHGLVHLLYFGHSIRKFELAPGLQWPDGSWAISSLFGDAAARTLASTACVLAATGFVLGGIGIFAEQAWWRPVVVGTALFSAASYLLLWNGKMNRLDGQGAFAILINLAILASVLVLRWPDFDF